MLKLVDKDPFSNGTEHGIWTTRNCDRCVKSAHYRGEDVCGMDMYTKCRCSIYRDIGTRMFSNEPIAQRTIDICQKRDCPFRQERWKKYPKKELTLKLFDI